MTRKKTRILYLSGGLGNQMFHYAYGIYFKNKSSDRELLYNKGGCQEHNNMELEKVFNLKIQTSFVDSAIFFIKRVSKKILKNDLNFVLKILSKMHSQILYNNTLFSNFDYLQGNRNEIITAFTFPNFDDKENLKIAKKIKNTNSVSIHIRLGDYFGTNFINLSKTNYYQLAIQEIRQIQMKKGQPNLTFFIFCDEADKGKKIFKAIGAVAEQDCDFVDCNQGKNAFRDMQLMSLCQHNIIANSSFSFWGAYLNQNQDKVVICPKSHVQYDEKYIIINQQKNEITTQSQ